MDEQTDDLQVFEVSEEAAGARLDKFLSEQVADLSRARLQALLKDGAVTRGGDAVSQASYKVQAGEVYELIVPPPVEWYPQAQDIPLEVIYEDDDILVLNKSVGLIVHPGAGNPDGTLVNALLHHCGDSLSGIGGVLRPGIVHRLDKDTSGVMVVAKNDFAHQALSEQLQDRSMYRQYEALVLGVPVPPLGRIAQPLGRHPQHRQKMAIVRRGGREAYTNYKTEQSYRNVFSLVRCTLETGRTHQIRVHMESIKSPIVGDPLYGPQPTAVLGACRRADYAPEIGEALVSFPRQALHARFLHFIHPRTGEECAFEAPLPDDMLGLLGVL